MFTGLIEDLGKIKDIKDFSGGKIFSVQTSLNTDEIKLGASISVNGACQSVIKKEKEILTFEAMAETLRKTNFNLLKKGDFVNLERAMGANSRFEGHIVSGHVDCVSKLNSTKNDGFAKIFQFECNTDLIVEMGSISINGISLTVSKLFNGGFEVSILPQTLDWTNLQYLKTGDFVNIEFDIFGKYVKKFTQSKKTEITEEFLIKNGF